MNRGETDIAALFDDMADEYDKISDLWYSWLFSNVHLFISKDLSVNDHFINPRCLDIGCGTGYQTTLFGLAGIKADGIDISSALIDVARKKNIHFFLDNPFWESTYKFVKESHFKTIHNIAGIRKNNPIQQPNYTVASATSLPFENETFQYINCIGSVLSFLDDYQKGLKEISRVLQSGGYFFVEFENKYNLDLFWALFDSCIKGKIGYDQKFSESWRNLLSKPSRHLRIDFPFSKHNETIHMPIWVFRARTLIKEMQQYDLETIKVRSIHSITNVIPSVWLDDPSPSGRMIKTFNFFSKIEKTLSSVYPFNHLGCSTYIFGRKK